ncbi:hypothetical protein WJX81_000245 [Elliptochloris bilobata]|uniref:Uncharacterized protein n=1 Tax=Elliptochloris bilobata TaxID=381761 RepID=A0AAW1QLF2_9CHLO
MPLTVHTTPFETRVARALVAQHSAGEAWQGGAPATPPPAGGEASATGADAPTGRPLSASNFARRPAAEAATSPGKENRHAAEPLSPEQATPALRPATHLHSRASYFFRTPSSETPSPHFVFDTRRASMGGTPCVIGVANPAARYREDRSVRIHDTPFEQRVEREVAKERAARSRAARRSSDTRMPTL